MRNMLIRIMNSMISSYNKLAKTLGRTITIKGIIGTLAGTVLAFLVLTGCEEDPSTIGGSILPQGDFNSTQSTDTLTVRFVSSFTDTVRSVNPYNSYFGSIIDPIFGTTSTGAVSQLWLYSDWPGTGISTIDSVFFYLNILDVIGEMGEGGVLNVYEIDEFLHEDSVYYVNRDVPLKSLLFSMPLAYIPGDTLIEREIPVAVGEYMLRDTSMLFLSSGEDDFRTFFKGLYFEYVQPAEDHMVRFDLTSGISYINVYYTNGAGDFRGHTFPVNSKCVKYNRFIHDFSTADPDKKINHINDGIVDSLSYIQNLEGVYTTVTIPGLEQLRGMMPLSINKARLFIPAYYDELIFPEANIFNVLLQARYINSDGVRTIFPDYELNPGFFDGQYYSLDHEYRINIANFIQLYLEGVIEEPAFELYLPYASQSNLILRSNSTAAPLRLEMVFSEY